MKGWYWVILGLESQQCPLCFMKVITECGNWIVSFCSKDNLSASCINRAVAPSALNHGAHSRAIESNWFDKYGIEQCQDLVIWIRTLSCSLWFMTYREKGLVISVNLNAGARVTSYLIFLNECSWSDSQRKGFFFLPLWLHKGAYPIMIVLGSRLGKITLSLGTLLLGVRWCWESRDNLFPFCA